ncbi:hypothetical protein ACHAXS_001230, partial [Conticribra weissflogii]
CELQQNYTILSQIAENPLFHHQQCRLQGRQTIMETLAKIRKGKKKLTNRLKEVGGGKGNRQRRSGQRGAQCNKQRR